MSGLSIAGHAPLTLRPYQETSLERTAETLTRGVRSQLGVAATGLGKALPTDELVLTPSGWTTMGAVRVGDSVIGGDGFPTQVVGVFPQGVRSVVEVEFSDGARVRCDVDHLWAVRDKHDVHRGRPWRVMRTADLGDRRWRVPLVTVEHESPALPLDPYLLGVLLGDGGLSTPGRVLVHTEHALAATLNLPTPCTLTKMRDDGPNGIGGTYIIGGPVGRGANPVLTALRLLGLEGERATTKRVPWVYTVASAADRLELLRGIMDADGSVRPKDNHVEITLANELLAADVAALVRSLGGTCRVTHKATSWVHRYERRDGDAWRCSIALDVCPFRWKADRWRPRLKYPPVRQIAVIRPVADAECVCIKVANDDGLFVVRDYVVTHNTVIFCALAERMGVPTLVLAHRDELIVQAAAKVLEVWPELGASKEAHVLLRANGHGQLMAGVALRNDGLGIVKAGANDVGARVVIASVQTLARQARLDKMPTHHFGLVIVDECHHAVADSYRRTLEHVRAGDVCTDPARHASTYDSHHHCDEGPLLLGVTATPDRGDGRGLGDLFGEIVWNFDILWGIRAGFLCDLRGLAIKLDVDMAGLKVKRGDYDQAQAAQMLTDADAPRLIVDAWLEHAKGRRTLAFTPTVASARELADEFTRRGVAAAMVSGDTPLDERRRLLRCFESGEIDVMANCAVLTEGYDNPRIDCVIVARPTKSRALYTQMVGRGTRRHPEKAETLVLDVVGATAQHSLVTIPSLFGLPEPTVWEGGELVAGAVAAHEQREIAAGRLRAEEVELFRQIASTIAWAEATDRRDGGKRYVMGLGKGKPTVVLARSLKGEGIDGDWWLAGLQLDDGGKSVLIADVPLETAQGVAEDFIRSSGVAMRMIDPEAKWRTQPPSPAQLRAAAKWRLKIDPSWTRGELSQALDAHIANRKERNITRR